MREITSHRVNPANDILRITVTDEPGSGGANHRYLIGGFDTSTNPSDPYQGDVASNVIEVLFQNGPIAEVGVNGVTHEALIAILIDRLEAFQRGPFANAHNAIALHSLQTAQSALLERTRERMARGVEGTHKV